MSNATQTPATDQAGTSLFIQALTSLHPGSGTALGVVDLPVQRERHTNWPVIASSTLKGILRDAVRRNTHSRNGDLQDLYAAFGPETAEADKHAGALSLTDGRILAFPVRSLRGVFAWVTCNGVLRRLQRDLALLSSPAGSLGQLRLPSSAPDKNQALCPQKSPLIVDSNKLVLEEFEFLRTGDENGVARWIAQHAVADAATQERITNHLVVLHDDDFTHYVRHSTEVLPRIAINYETKTVKTGALFYQEFLPPETLFYSILLANASRREGHKKAAREILDYVAQHLPPVLQIGGDETIGKGWCAIKLAVSNRKETGE
jgi:CRISPR-associated protein Cmr4